MARCTAPVNGHRTASAAAACPACSGRSRSYGHTHTPPLTLHPTPLRGAARRPEQGGGSAAAQSRAGREPVRPWCTRLPRCGHSRRSAKASRSERPCLTFGTSFSATRGTTGRGRQGAARSARVTRCLGLVQREGRCPRHAVAPRNRQGTGEVASRDRAGDPCAAAPPPRRGHRRQRAFGTPSA